MSVPEAKRIAPPKILFDPELYKDNFLGLYESNGPTNSFIRVSTFETMLGRAIPHELFHYFQFKLGTKVVANDNLRNMPFIEAGAYFFGSAFNHQDDPLELLGNGFLSLWYDPRETIEICCGGITHSLQNIPLPVPDTFFSPPGSRIRNGKETFLATPSEWGMMLGEIAFAATDYNIRKTTKLLLSSSAEIKSVIKGLSTDRRNGLATLIRDA